MRRQYCKEKHSSRINLFSVIQQRSSSKDCDRCLMARHSRPPSWHTPHPLRSPERVGKDAGPAGERENARRPALRAHDLDRTSMNWLRGADRPTHRGHAPNAGYNTRSAATTLHVTSTNTTIQLAPSTILMPHTVPIYTPLRIRSALNT